MAKLATVVLCTLMYAAPAHATDPTPPRPGEAIAAGIVLVVAGHAIGALGLASVTTPYVDPRANVPVALAGVALGVGTIVGGLWELARGIGLARGRREAWLTPAGVAF